ncbi:MAG: enolase C-terminal domain-like protein [Pseudomonadota bacterium]
MRIDQVKVHQITLPFIGEFSHSRRKGADAENIVVEVIAGHGDLAGYGEGAPRPYVTGESQESAASHARALVGLKGFPWELSDPSEIWRLIDENSLGKENNTATCAVEMALLDALGKSQGRSVTDYFSKSFYTNRITYGAQIPIAHRERVEEICALLKRLRIDKIRIKMGTDFERNQETMDLVRRILGKGCDLRVDVNGSWDRAMARRHTNLMINSKVKVVEEPMMRGDPGLRDFSRRMREHGIALMADESACCLAEASEIVREGCYGMINVRLSKCGGFRNSLKIISFLREEGLSFQIGCQLGESGILSAAGRALGLLCRDAVYFDGSYDALLLAENITREHVGFGVGGAAGPLVGPGLGITVNAENLNLLSNRSAVITIKRP